MKFCSPIFIFLFFLSLPVISLAGEVNTLLAIQNANVIPMDSNRVLREQTVLISGNTIVAMGSSDAIKVPEGSMTVDANGKFLIPGLFDMHIHINRGRERSLVLYLANGVTTVRNMSGSPWHLDLKKRIERKELVAPRFFTTSPTTYGARLENTPEAAEEFVKEQKRAGYDSIKMYGTRPDYGMSIETYRRFMQTARKLDIRVVGHTPRGIPFQTVLDEGQSSIDHAEEIYYVYRPVLEKLGPVAGFQFGKIKLDEYRRLKPGFPNLDAEIRPLIKTLAKRVAASNVAFCPGLVTYETILRQITSEYKKMLANPQLRFVYPLWRLYASPGYNSYRGRWSDRLEEMKPILRNTLEIQKIMVEEFHKAGVPIMAGTDATNPLVIEGFSLHDELERLSDAGLSRYEVLRSATITPARFLGIEKEVGTIAVGKTADLVLVNGNPLSEIGNTRKIHGVVRSGTWYSKSSLDESLESLAGHYAPFWKAIQDSRNYFSKGDIEGAFAVYSQIENKTSEIARYFESTVNRRGYRLIRSKNLEEAKKVFELNTKYFPASANAWDSLAEVNALLGNKEAAITFYRRSLELDPENTNAAKQIKLLQAETKGNPHN